MSKNKYSQSFIFSGFLLSQHALVVLLSFRFFEIKFLLFSYLCFFLFKGIGSEIGAHRYFTHQSFKTKTFFERLFIFLQTFSGEGSILAFAGVHRTHHCYADTEKDPHPSGKSWFVIWFWLKIPHFELMVIRDLLKSPLLVFQHRFYYAFHFLLFLSLMWLNPSLYLHLIAIPIVLTCSANAFVNIFCHGFGYRSYETPDQSTNNTIVNLWTLGTGLHNNHHAFPKKFDNRMKPHEIDVLGFLIRSLFLRS